MEYRTVIYKQKSVNNMKRFFIFCWVFGIFFIVSLAHLNCSNAQKSQVRESANPILTGWLSPQKIFDQFQEYKLEKEKYQPDNTMLDKLKVYSIETEIIVFLGTWCPDSQREVPRFLKIMDLIQNSHINYKLFGLDRSKRDAGGLAERHQIEFVPTFVVLQNKQEIGRIVETPIVSIEQDLDEIFSPRMQ